MYQKACEAAELGDGEVVWCDVAGQDLAVYRVKDEFFASDNRCSHGSTSLSEGELNGYEIECPLHRGSFDIRTGAPVALPCIQPIRVYPVKVQDGDVLVSLEAGE
jgi:nitrite reductase/ring-hydroxylating ferredoxin subunit